MLANDIAPFQAALVSGVSSGLLSLNADGSFTYTPNPNFVGVDSFTYRPSLPAKGHDVRLPHLDTVTGVRERQVAPTPVPLIGPATVTITVVDPSPGDNEPPMITTGKLVFEKQVVDNTVDEVHHAEAADLNGDQLLDLIATDFIDGDVYWYENDGNGGFIKHTVDANLAGAYPAHLGDVDLDGDIDVLAGGYVADVFAWYENDGVGGFTRHDIDTGNGANGAHSIVTVDMDGDLDIDLLTTNQDGGDVHWYENDGSENFTRHVIDDTLGDAKRAQFADLDGDLDIDVFAAGNLFDEIVWYENDGSQNFVKHPIDGTVDGAYFVWPATIDAGVTVDILTASQNDNTIAVYKNDGAGNFTKQVIDASAVGARSVIAADIDRDGDIDPLSTSVTDDRLGWYENDGAGGFTKRAIDTTADGPYGVTTVDFDNDGDIDIVSASRDNNEVAIHFQTRLHQAQVTTVGGQMTIDAALLTTTDVDNGPSELVYTLTQAPASGDVRLNGSPLSNGSTFTQDDVNNNAVTYLHDGVGTIADQFAYTVSDGSSLTPACGRFALSLGDGDATAYWPLDESTGTVATDAIGGNHGALFGGPVWRPTAGRVGGALQTDGADDRVDLGTPDVAGSGITLALWVRPIASTGSARLISKATGTAEQDHYWMISAINGTGLRFRLKAGGSTSTLVTAQNQMPIGQWTHVACTYDGAQMRVYSNGALVASTGKTGSVATNGAVLAAIANQPTGAGSDPLNGYVDDVRIYSRALSPTEIGQLAALGSEMPFGAPAPDRVTAPVAVSGPVLHGGFPNPFNPETTIRYTLPHSAKVSIDVFDVTGKHVRTLVTAVQAAGPQEARWDGHNSHGMLASSGVYFAHLRVAQYTSVAKIVMIK